MATKTNRFNISTEFLLVALLVPFITCPGLALAQSPFYQGKTITIVQGRDPGGTGDMRVRAHASVLAEVHSRQPNHC